MEPLSGWYPKVDQRFHGVPQAIVDEEQARKEVVISLTRQVLQHPQKGHLRKDLFPECGDRYKPTSDSAKQIIKYQGGIEAFELRELKDKIQCEHCHRYVSAGRLHCYCGRLLTYEDSGRVIQEQSQRCVQQRLELLKNPANKLRRGPGQGRGHGAASRQIAFCKSKRGIEESSNHSSEVDDGRNAPRIAIANSDCMVRRNDGKMDELALADRSYVATKGERQRYEQDWVVTHERKKRIEELAAYRSSRRR